MKTRILKLHLGRVLQAEIKKRSKSEVAAKIGVSSQKLTAMMNDDWRYITRSAIERTADYLQLEADKVFEFVPVEFWSQILASGKCTFLRGAQDEKGNEQDVKIQRADANATNLVTHLLHEHDLEYTYADHSREADELLNRARTENCIVIGSPKSNAATEILLSRFFDADPFNPSDDNRRKIPFGFCWPDLTEIVNQSSLTCSTLARKRTKNLPGIAVKKDIHVPADYMDPETFQKIEISKGKDCGLVFVANKPFGTDQNVKLIVLAGFSGLGTIGAAKALIDDFRYLEPQPGEEYVYGVIQCRYSKAANSKSRTFKRNDWIVRVGGSWPIKVKVRKKALPL